MVTCGHGFGKGKLCHINTNLPVDKVKSCVRQMNRVGHPHSSKVLVAMSTKSNDAHVANSQLSLSGSEARQCIRVYNSETEQSVNSSAY